MNRERERAERGPGGPPSHNRLSSGYRSTPPSSSSPRPPLPSGAGPQSGVSPSERNSPLSGRGGPYGPHHPQGSSSPSSGSSPASPYTPSSSGGATPTSTPSAPSPASPPAPHGHAVPHSHSLPHSLSEAVRPVNGGSCVHLFTSTCRSENSLIRRPNKLCFLCSLCQNISQSPKTPTVEQNSPRCKLSHSDHR